MTKFSKGFHLASGESFTLSVNLHSSINLAGMLLDGGKKPDHPEEIHADLGRTHKLHT